MDFEREIGEVVGTDPTDFAPIAVFFPEHGNRRSYRVDQVEFTGFKAEPGDPLWLATHPVEVIATETVQEENSLFWDWIVEDQGNIVVTQQPLDAFVLNKQNIPDVLREAIERYLRGDELHAFIFRNEPENFGVIAHAGHGGGGGGGITGHTPYFFHEAGEINIEDIAPLNPPTNTNDDNREAEPTNVVDWADLQNNANTVTIGGINWYELYPELGPPQTEEEPVPQIEPIVETETPLAVDNPGEALITWLNTPITNTTNEPEEEPVAQVQEEDAEEYQYFQINKENSPHNGWFCRMVSINNNPARQGMGPLYRVKLIYPALATIPEHAQVGNRRVINSPVRSYYGHHLNEVEAEDIPIYTEDERGFLKFTALDVNRAA
jgi:hypothetical protein